MSFRKLSNLPALLGSGAALARAEEFFFAHIENHNTRAAYERAVKGFFLYIRKNGIDHFSQVTPVLVSRWVQDMKAAGSNPPRTKTARAQTHELASQKNLTTESCTPPKMTFGKAHFRNA